MITQDRINPIQDIKVETKLSTAHKQAAQKAIADIDGLKELNLSVLPAALHQHHRDTLKAFAEGKATLDQALALSVLTGVTDETRIELSNGLLEAINNREIAILKSIAPVVIEFYTQRTDSLRLRSAATETSEQESADICGIPFEPSETCKRLKATFLHSLDRLRELRDSGALPSKGELRSITE